MDAAITEMIERIAEAVTWEVRGTLSGSSGTTLEAIDFPTPLGAVAQIDTPVTSLFAEVIGFRDGRTILAPWVDPVQAGVRPGLPLRLVRSRRYLGVGPEYLGRAVNAIGEPIDVGPPIRTTQWRKPEGESHAAVGPLERPPIDEPLPTGVRAIDGLLTLGRGQRIAILAGSGVGKSVLLGMIARGTAADVVVCALIGERNREAGDFLTRELGGVRDRSVCVVATSDEPAICRVHALETAMTLAESFRDDGKQVLLLVDSLTRFAMAQREIGLAFGEPPATRGYPPSVFGMLPRILERAGRTRSGSITAICTVLVEADDPQDPIGDAVRGILDGHLWLSRSLAGCGHYPAIDILQSVSRLMPDLVTPVHRAAAAKIRERLAVWAQHEDLITLGAYRRGSDSRIDAAIDAHEPIERFLRQDFSYRVGFSDTVRELLILVRTLLELRHATG